MTSAPCPRNPWLLAPVDAETVKRLAAETGLSATTARVLAAGGSPTRAAGEGVPVAIARPRLARPLVDSRAGPTSPTRSRRRSATASASRCSATSTLTASPPQRSRRAGCALGADAFAFVPHRFDEGYGLSARGDRAAPRAVARVRGHGRLRYLVGRRGRAAARPRSRRGGHRPSRARRAGSGRRAGRRPQARARTARASISRVRGSPSSSCKRWGSVSASRRCGGTLTDLAIARHDRRHRSAHRREPRAGRRRAVARMRSRAASVYRGPVRRVAGTSTDQMTSEIDRLRPGAATERRRADGRPGDRSRAAHDRRPHARPRSSPWPSTSTTALRQAVEADLMAEAAAAGRGDLPRGGPCARARRRGLARRGQGDRRLEDRRHLPGAGASSSRSRTG